MSEPRLEIQLVRHQRPDLCDPRVTAGGIGAGQGDHLCDPRVATGRIRQHQRDGLRDTAVGHLRGPLQPQQRRIEGGPRPARAQAAPVAGSTSITSSQ